MEHIRVIFRGWTPNVEFIVHSLCKIRDLDHRKRQPRRDDGFQVFSFFTRHKMEQSFVKRPLNIFLSPYIWPLRNGLSLESGGDVNDFVRSLLLAILFVMYSNHDGIWKWLFFGFLGWIVLLFLFMKFDVWRTGGVQALQLFGIEPKTYWALPDAPVRPGTEGQEDKVIPPALIDEVNNPYGNPSFVTYDLAVRSAQPNVAIREEGDDMFENLWKPVGTNRDGWFMNTVPDPTLMGFLPSM